ncbi:MAG: dTMP kinase [Propionibacteriaceae bacterium]
MGGAVTSGLFIVFEGGDGAGKTTQAELLANFLQERGETVVMTRQPGGTGTGTKIRQIVLAAPGGEPLSPRAEFLLFAADKAQHVAELVRPALGRGEVVVCDRYTDSSLAYQGAGRVLSVAELAELLEWATDALVPDLTVLLDVAPEASVVAKEGKDRIEIEGVEFHERVRQGFLTLARRHPSRYLVLNARDSRDQIADAVAARVEKLLCAE